MLSLKQNIDHDKHKKEEPAGNMRMSIRDKLLVREVQELEKNSPKTCQVEFNDPNQLHVISLMITPDEGYWVNGKFKFLIEVPEEYNNMPPKVHCLTRIWHPNISEDGEVCLSILRESSFDGLGWAPTRQLIHVIWGLDSLFTDLLNFDDPLNLEAAEHFEKNRTEFIKKVKEYVQRYAR